MMAVVQLMLWRAFVALSSPEQRERVAAWDEAHRG